MEKNTLDMMFRTLRVAIAGTCGLIASRLFELEGLWNFAVFIVVFGIISASYDAYINYHFRNWSKKQIRVAKIVSWIVFILLVVLLSYLNMPKSLYF